jgi:hypothetical protein
MNIKAPAIPATLKPVVDLEAILTDMLQEHRKLLVYLNAQQDAMQKLALKEMEASRQQQEASRSRIIGLENRRRTQAMQIARINQLQTEPKLPQLAQMYPQRRAQLMQLHSELKAVMNDVATRSYIASKLASAVLGHLNTAMRIISTAVGGGGVYTQRGTPKMSRRIGVMEAVG